MPDKTRKQSSQYMFPFAASPPFKDFQTWNGGCLRLLPGALNANVDISVKHTLKIVPRAVLIISSGKSYTPAWKISAVTPPSSSTITIQLSTAIAAGDTLVLLVY